MENKIRIAIFASGRGTDAYSVIKAWKDGYLSEVEVVLLVSNKINAKALSMAESEGIKSFYIDHNLDNLPHILLELLNEHKIDLIVLAGYLKKVPKELIATYPNSILNIHPAVDLKRFGGKGLYGHHVHEAVIRAGEKVSGATVHLVDEEYDHGEKIMQVFVPVLPDDTPQTLAERILVEEHILLPAAIKAWIRLYKNKIL